MHIYGLPPTLNIYHEAHRETSHKPLQHHLYWSPAARHGLPAWPAYPAQREDHARDGQPMLLTAAAPNADVERTRMMKCKPHARTQSTPVVVALPCAPVAHCREAAAVVEPSARPRHPRGEDDEMRKLRVFRPPGRSVAELQPRSWVYSCFPHFLGRWEVVGGPKLTLSAALPFRSARRPLFRLSAPIARLACRGAVELMFASS
jgi:hypothetical protein